MSRSNRQSTFYENAALSPV